HKAKAQSHNNWLFHVVSALLAPVDNFLLSLAKVNAPDQKLSK
ncbi:MAG: hypothetical protein ACI86S_002324, partial [Paracoccaceae bacterium]